MTTWTYAVTVTCIENLKCRGERGCPKCDKPASRRHAICTLRIAYCKYKGVNMHLSIFEGCCRARVATYRATTFAIWIDRCLTVARHSIVTLVCSHFPRGRHLYAVFARCGVERGQPGGSSLLVLLRPSLAGSFVRCPRLKAGYVVGDRLRQSCRLNEVRRRRMQNATRSCVLRRVAFRRATALRSRNQGY